MPNVIFDQLASTIRSAFPAQSIKVVPGGELIFSAAYPSVGDLTVYIEEDDVTVLVANRHFHIGFSAADARSSSKEATDRLATQLVTELRDIFDNRLLFRISALRFPETKQLPWWRRLLATFNYKTCVWSGPL